MRVLSIDPSINNVGWTLFEITDQHRDAFRQALKGGALTPLKAEQFASVAKRQVWKWGTIQLEGTNLQMRIMDLVHMLIIKTEGRFDYLITEKPAFYSSEKGVIAARQNYTIDLAAVGYFVAGWFRMDHRKHHPITAITWKGSVSKQITAKAFFRFFGDEAKAAKGTSEHSIDSTMLLHYWLKTFAMASPLVARHTDPELIRVLL